MGLKKTDRITASCLFLGEESPKIDTPYVGWFGHFLPVAFHGRAKRRNVVPGISFATVSEQDAR